MQKFAIAASIGFFLGASALAAIQPSSEFQDR
jgi:hypothetical protein